MPGFGSGGFGSGSFSLDPFFSTKDLIDEVLRNTGHRDPASETQKRISVLGFLNHHYAAISANKHWEWLYRREDYNLDEPYDTGTISATQGSNVINGVGTLFSSNVIPYNKLIVRDKLYTVTEVVSTTQLKIEGEYVDETESGLGYKIVKPIKRLPGYVDVIRSMSIDGVGELVPLGTQELRRKQQMDPGFVGAPRWFSETIRRAEDGIRYVEVWPNPDQKYIAHIDFSVVLERLDDAADNFPLIPDKYRVVLYYGALADMYRFLSDPTNEASAQKAYDRVYLQMVGDTQLTDSRMILQPSRNYKNRRSRRYRVAMSLSDFAKYE